MRCFRASNPGRKLQKDFGSGPEGGSHHPGPVLPLVIASKGTVMTSEQTGETKKGVMGALARAGRSLLEASLCWTGA